MSEPTNEELRQACEDAIEMCSHGPECPVSRCYLARGLLSRLDREAEAEQDVRATVTAYMDNYRESFVLKEPNRLISLTEKLAEAERLLKVVREALEYYDRGTDWAEMDGSIAHNALAEIAPAAPGREKPYGSTV